MKIRIGSRGSELALWQARYVQVLLKEKTGVDSDIAIIQTKGDNLQHVSFNQIEGKGFFTKEIEEALLARQIDLAVHSLKDLPTEMTPGLEVAALSEREDPRDVLLIHPDAYDTSKDPPLIEKGTVGTSSNRRKRQLANLRPDLTLIDVRGNVPTRLRKLKDRQFDGLIMAMAGLKRLNLDISFLRTVLFDPTRFIPNPGQGILGLQIRRDDTAVRAYVEKLNDALSHQIVAAERGLLARMQGGCQLALGAYCLPTDRGFGYYAFWDELNGRPSHRFEATSDDPHRLAESAYYAFMQAAQRLSGRTVVITRPESQAEEWRKELERFGARVLSRPAIRIVPDVDVPALDVAVQNMSRWSWILFTSANSVSIFWEELTRRGIKVASGTRVAAIGRSTEAELKTRGVQVEFVPAKSNGVDFAREAARRVRGQILLPCGHQAGTDVEDELRKQGLQATRINLYRTETSGMGVTQLTEPVDFIVFASPSSFEAFVKHSTIPAGTQIISIGPKTSEHIRHSGRSDFLEASGPSIQNVILKMLNPTA